MNEIIEVIRKLKPDLSVKITKSPLINQKPYEVSDEKFRGLGFEPRDNLYEAIEKSIKLFGGIKN